MRAQLTRELPRHCNVQLYNAKSDVMFRRLGQHSRHAKYRTLVKRLQDDFLVCFFLKHIIYKHRSPSRAGFKIALEYKLLRNVRKEFEIYLE